MEKISRAEKYINDIDRKLYLIPEDKRDEKKIELLNEHFIKYLNRKYPSFNGVSLFIENGANPNLNNSEALILSCMYCSLRTVKYLLQKSTGTINLYSLFIGACKYGKLSTAKFLHSLEKDYFDRGNNFRQGNTEKDIMENTEKNVMGKEHKTIITMGNNDAVIWAADYGSLKTVKYLIGQGADISAQNGFALKLAICSGKREMVKYILSLNMIDITGDNYITFALERNDIKTVKLLVKYGANITNFDNEKYEKITGKKLITKDKIYENIYINIFDEYNREYVEGDNEEYNEEYNEGYNDYLFDELKRRDKESEISNVLIRYKIQSKLKIPL